MGISHWFTGWRHTIKMKFLAAACLVAVAFADPEAGADAWQGSYGYGLPHAGYSGYAVSAYAAPLAYGHGAGYGYGAGYGAGRGYWKRSADAEPEAEAEAEPEAEADPEADADASYSSYGYGLPHAGYSGYAVSAYAAPLAYGHGAGYGYGAGYGAGRGYWKRSAD